MNSLFFLLFLEINIPYIKPLLAIIAAIGYWRLINWKEWTEVWGPLLTLFIIGGLRANNAQIAFIGHPLLGCGFIDWLAISLLCSINCTWELDKAAKCAAITTIFLKLGGLSFGHPGEEAIAFFLLGLACNSRYWQIGLWMISSTYGNRSIFLGAIAWAFFCSNLPRWQKIMMGIGMGLTGGFLTWQRISAGYDWSSDRLLLWKWAINLIEPFGYGIHNPIFADTYLLDALGQHQKNITASLHNIFIDVGYGGGWLGIIAFIRVLLHYECRIIIPAIITLLNWYFCSSNFWVLWLVLKKSSTERKEAIQNP